MQQTNHHPSRRLPIRKRTQADWCLIWDSRLRLCFEEFCAKWLNLCHRFMICGSFDCFCDNNNESNFLQGTRWNRNSFSVDLSHWKNPAFSENLVLVWRSRLCSSRHQNNVECKRTETFQRGRKLKGSPFPCSENAFSSWFLGQFSVVPRQTLLGNDLMCSWQTLKKCSLSRPIQTDVGTGYS